MHGIKPAIEVAKSAATEAKGEDRGESTGLVETLVLSGGSFAEYARLLILDTTEEQMEEITDPWVY